MCISVYNRHVGNLSLPEMDFAENASFFWVIDSKFSQFRLSPVLFSIVPHLDFLQGTKKTSSTPLAF